MICASTVFVDRIKRLVVVATILVSFASQAEPSCGGAHNVGCGNTFSLSSPGYPSNYISNQKCDWILFANEGTLKITFRDFKTEASNDVLDVGNAGSSEASQTYSGSTLPSSWTSQGNSIWLNWTSDNSVVDEGWDIIVTSLVSDGKCDHYVECGSSFQLKSPYYPNNYADDDRLEWRINTTGAYFTIKFADFAGGASDILEIGNGDDTTADVELSGSTLPSLWTSKANNSIWIKWATNLSGNDKGWDLTINSVPWGVCDMGVACGSLVELRSPNFPRDYNNDETIAWYFYTNADYFIVSFSAFDAENNNDILEVANAGSSYQALSAVRSYTGNNIPDSWTSHNSTLEITWKADSKGPASGWSIIVVALPDAQCPVCYASDFICGDLECIRSSWECDDIVDCNDGSDEDGCPTTSYASSYAEKYASSSSECPEDDFVCDDGECIPGNWRCDDYVDCDDSSDEDDCNEASDCRQYFELKGHADKVVVETPNYPDSYNVDDYCELYFNTTPELYLSVHFVDFDTEQDYDFLAFGSGTNASDVSSVFFEHSGQTLPWDFTVEGNELWAVWFSDESMVYGGFKLVVEALECGGRYYMSGNVSVNVSSPTYPSLYNNNEDCYWYVTAPVGWRVSIYFLEFRSSTNDNLYVGNGNTVDANSLAFVHSGTADLPRDWTTDGNAFWVRWVTGSTSVREKGWNAIVEALECGGRFYIDELIAYEDFETPKYPNDYGPNLDCLWLLTTHSGDYLTTHFNSFITERNRDVVVVGTGHDPDNKTSTVITGTGETVPSDWLSNTHKLWVRFVSDPSIGASGFSLRVQYVSSLETTTEEPAPTEYILEISCFSNCEEVVTADYSVSARAYCYNCVQGAEMRYSWSLTYTASTLGLGTYGDVDISGRFTSTGTQSQFISINGGQLNDGYTYKLRANVTDGRSGYGGDTWKFVTNAPPTSGNCSASPQSGYTLNTEFTVRCENWFDTHTPLRYMFFSKPKGPDTLKSLLFSGESASTPAFTLSVGKEAYDYEVDIIVDIVDFYDSKATEVLTVTVEPLSLGEEDLTQAVKNLTSGDNNRLAELLDSGDKEGAVSLVITVASVLNDGADSVTPRSQEELDERKEIRGSIISNLKTVSQTVASVDEVTQMASALLAMTSVPDELSEDSQVDTAVAMESLSGSLVTMTNETESSILSSATAITEAIGNVLSVATDSTDADNAVQASTSSSVVKSTVNTVNSVSKAVLSKRVPGQPPVVMNTTSLTIQLQRDEPTDIGGSTLSSDAGNFQLPAAETLLGSKSGESYVDTQFLSFTNNPFNWDNSSQYISSPVISLSFEDESGSAISVSGLSEDIEIQLPMNSDLPDAEPLNTSLSDSSDSALFFYEVQIPTAYSAIHFRVFPSADWDDLNYTLLFNQGVAPSLTSYNLSGYLPNNEYENDGDLDIATKEELKTTFFVPSDLVTGAGSYFIGIQAIEGDLNISVQMFTSGCRYWDEVEEQYKGDGCSVSPKSSSLTTICKCTHLTSFGSDFFVPPNSIDFSTVFSKFSNLGENASVFSTIIVIFVVYVLLVIWARREDRKDIEKWGVSPLPDNRPGHRYLYQITVYTGLKSGAGTRSKVRLILRGKRGETQVRRLKDTKRRVFKRGSICSFLMAVPGPLGDLASLTVWHDNSGKGQAASWYLSKIVVHDVQTKEATYFLCERWLAVENDDGQIHRELPVSSEADMVAFNHLFVSHAKRDLTDGHIWFSFLSRPTRSNFTRVQRLTCCLSLLYTTMIANCMWFRGDDEETTGQMIKIGPFTFAWQSIYVGIMGSLVVFPVNVLLIQLFRKSRRKDVSPMAREESGNEASGSGVAYETPASESEKDIGEILRNMEDGDAYYERALSRRASRMGLVSTHDATTEKNFASAPAVNNGWPGSGKMPENGGPPPYNGAVPDSTADQTEKKKKKLEKKPSGCPHWFVYIGYCVAFLSSATAAFFTVLYSMEWGHDKSVEWLVSFFMSFFQSVMVIQPMKVLCIAVLLALIFKRYESDVEVEDVTPQEDEDYLHPQGTYKDNFKPMMRPVFQPADPAKLEEIRVQREKEIKMMALIKEITIYLLYMLVLCSLAYANRDKYAYYLHQSIDQQLFQNYHFDNLEGGFSYFEPWMTNVVIPTLYPTLWYDGNQTLSAADMKFISDLSSFRVGPPRLRHLRIKPGLCRVLSQFSALIPNCYGEYSFGGEDERPFNQYWAGANDSASVDSMWRYHSSEDLDGLPIYGVRRPFSGGGYVSELGTSGSEVETSWREIWDSRWVDHYTRAVLLEFPLYNANVNLFSMVTLLMEFPATGATLVFPRIAVLRLYNYVGPTLVFNLLCELIFIGFTIYYLVHAIMQIKKTKMQYFKSFFNWVEMAKTALCIAGIALHIYKNIYLALAKESLAGSGSEDFVNLQEIAAWDELFLYVLSAVVFMSFLKFIHILRFNSNITLLGKTIRGASGSLVSFGVMFSLVSFAFTQLFYLLIGSSVDDYRTLIVAAETLLAVWLGIFDFHETVAPQPVLAPIVFFFFNFVMVFVLTTVFVAVIMYAREEAKAQGIESEYEMYEFIKGNVRDIATGLCAGDGDDSDDEEEWEDDTEISKEPIIVIPLELCDVAALELRITWLDNWLLRALKQYGINVTRSEKISDRTKKRLSLGEDDSTFPALPRRCLECRAKMTPYEIERHMIFLCPKLKAQRRLMFRRMVEVIGDVDNRMVRSRARSWWRFYRDNSKTIQLTTVDVASGTFEVCKQSMVFYDLPARLKRTLSAVVTDFLQETLLDKWKALRQKGAVFNLQNFIV